MLVYSYMMLVKLHRMRERGWPIPRYQFAFKPTIPGELTVSEVRDEILNRYTRVATLRDVATGAAIASVPKLLDVQLVGMTREYLSLSGIERVEDELLSKVEDFAQTWICWLE